MSNHNFNSEEIKFLAGPQSRVKDFLFTIKVVWEFVKGFRVLHFVGPCITIFGSARFKEDHPYYVQTRELAGKIARTGFTIMTGGGPGAMEAANRGAKDVGGRSVGCNIVLPFEPTINCILTVDGHTHVNETCVYDDVLRPSVAVYVCPLTVFQAKALFIVRLQFVVDPSLTHTFKIKV